MSDIIKQKEAHEVVRQTIEFYKGSPAQRAVSNGVCEYVSNDGRRCAVGRCMLESIKHGEYCGTWSALRPGDKLKPLNMNALKAEERELLLKPEYRGLSGQMWGRLQYWHDEPIFWNAEGLTPHGKQEADELLQLYPAQ
jgi:hypothetical protein